MNKKVVLAVALVLLVVVGAPTGAHLWGRSKLAPFEARWRDAIQAERARVAALRRPVLHGEPLDENAAPRYRRLLDPIGRALKEDKGLGERLKVAALADPFAPLAPEVLKDVEARRGDVAGLREAVRCTRCDWELEYEKGVELKYPEIAPSRVLSQLVIVSGHLRAQAGDVEGAAAHYLDAARFGADHATGTMLMILIASAIEDQALRALERLIVAPGKPALALDPLTRAIDKLLAVTPDPVHGFELERQALGSLGGLKDVGGLLVPGTAILADAASTMDPILRDAAVAAASRDKAERARIDAASKQTLESSGNPIVQNFFADTGRIRRQLEQIPAHLRLLRVAIELERKRAASGSYPADVELPEDPFVPPDKLRYALGQDGKGWKLWSVGVNEKDDGGSGDDIVLERAVK